MALVTSQQFQSPSILQGIQQGLVNRGEVQRQGRLTREEENRQRLSGLAEQQQAEQRGLLQRARGVEGVDPTQATQQEAVDLYFANNPEEGEKLFKRVGIETKEQKEKAAVFAESVLNAQDDKEIDFLIDENVRRIAAEGGNPSDSLRLKELPREQLVSVMRATKAAALTAAQRETGALTREQISAKKETEKPGGVSPVQSSSILEDGNVQIVRKDGTTEVVSPGDAQREIVKRAKEFGAELQGLRSGERKAADAAIKKSTEAFDKLKPIEINIANLTKGMQLIDDGAETGVIAKQFPSIREASVKMKQLQGQLGLDVLRNTTFGALSASELAFALDTAIPLGLEGEPLKGWLQEKRDAQIKMSNYMREAAIFLGTPGNTIADFLSQKKETAKGRGQEQPVVAALPQDVTEDDIAETMRANNMTREQVLERLGGQ